jgi:tRNA(Ile)-lysidine synthetase-like protein
MTQPIPAWPPPGRYILAVSGGADSMTLLHLFATAAPTRGYQLVVAHFDHGLRPDSAADHDLVRATATAAHLPFAGHHAHLSPGSSEAAARAARYAWLQHIRARHHAAAVVTAHHADDLLETSLLNLARGTGRRGLAPMQPTGLSARPGRSPAQPTPILRPLLGITRAALRAYAAAHHVVWREDPTNAELTNPRNFLRHQLLPHATPAWHEHYRALIVQLAALNRSVDARLAALLDRHHTNPTTFTFPRGLVRDLSPAELAELILAAAYRLSPAIQLDQRLLAEMVMFAKTSPPHRHRPLRQGVILAITPTATELKIANPPQNPPDIVY